MQVPTYQLLSEYLTNTRDASEDNKTVGKQRMDNHYTFLLSQANNHVTERKKYGNMKGNQRSYFLPYDYIPNGMKMIQVYVNDRWHPLDLYLPAEHWAEHTAVVRFEDIPTRYTIKNEQGKPYIEIDGIPDQDVEENIEITYLGYQDPLIFPTPYTTGTVSLIYGQPYVNGSGLVFTREMEGRSLLVNGGKNWYEIARYGSDILLSLTHNYQEYTINNTAYTIAEVPRLPHEFHYTIMYGAVADYYRPKNAQKAKEFDALYNRDVLLIQSRYQNKTQGSVTPGIPVSRYMPRVPGNYPQTLITRIS